MLKPFMLSAIVALVISSFTLWLIESQTKYFFFFFEVSFIVLLFLVFSKTHEVKFTLIARATRISLYSFRDCLCIASSLSLLFLNLYKVDTIPIVLAIFTSSFLPGFVFLRLMNFHCSNSHFETLILSFALSIPLTSIISLFLVPIAGRGPLIDAVYLFLSFLPIVKNKIEKGSEPIHETSSKEKHTYELFHTLLIGLIILFFCFTIFQLYPQMAWDNTLDIGRHYSNALLFSRFPYSRASQYPFFIIFEATIAELSLSSMVIVKTALAFMSITVILSFYIVANSYLKKIDNRLPIIATIAWFLFSGFGWLYFLREKLTNLNVSQINLLSGAYDKSYADVGYGISANLWLWFLPMTVSFTIFFTLLYLLTRTDLSRRCYVSIFSLTMISLLFIHTSELVMFIALLFVLSLLAPRIRLRLGDALFSTLISLVGSTLLMIYFSKLGLMVPIPYYLILIMFATTSLAFLSVLRRQKTSHISKEWSVVFLISSILLILFSAGFFSWLFSKPSFLISDVIEIQFVPWLLYPVRLGIVGLLGLIGALIVARKYHFGILALFICLLFSGLFVGRIVSIINLYYPTEYWEWRFLFFIFAAASILAPIAMLRAGNHVLPRNWKVKRVLLSTLLIGIVVLGGMSSTFLTLELRIPRVPNSTISQQTVALSFFSDLLKNNTMASLVTIPESSSIPDLLPVSYSYQYLLPAIWTSKYPEVPLSILYNQKYPTAFVYLSNQDNATLNEEYKDGYLCSHLLNSMPTVLGTSDVHISKSRDGVPPSLNSKTVLVVPSDSSSNRNGFFAYDLLSLGGYNFTLMLDSDSNILNDNVIILPSDKSTDISSEILDNLGTSSKKLVVLNLDGYGPFAESFLEFSKGGEFNATQIVGKESKINLPLEFAVCSSFVKDNVESLGSYENGRSEAVFAARKTVGQSEIIYVNVYPLIKAILSNEGDVSRDLSSILGRLLDMAKIDAPPYDRHVISWIMDDSTPFLIFNDATLNGNVSVKSTSLCLPSGITLETANIEYDGHVLSLDNVTSLSINAGNKINISAQKMEIGKGEGFYSTITANNPEINIEGANPHPTLTLANGSIVEVNGESKIKLSVPAQLQIYVRDPSVQVDGFVIFREAYAIHSYQTTLMTLGQELKIQGNIAFEVPLSDTYSFATELVWRGSFERSPPLLPWNELGSLSESIPWLIVSSLLFITLFLACTRARGRELKIKLKIKRQQSL